MTNIDYKKITSPYVQKYNIAPPIPNSIVFYNDIEGKKVEVLRITKNGIMANPNVPVDEAAEAIIRALDGYIKNLTQRTWAGLTNGEMIELSEMKLGSWDLILEVEAKLKEKNT